MQINSVYLYPNKIDAYTNPLGSVISERYRRVYNRNVKVYRNVDNRIDLQLRNSDQKPLSISNNVLVFNLVSRDTMELLIKKDYVLIPDDPETKVRGRAYVMLTRQEMEGIEPGMYQYSVTQETREFIGDSDEYIVTQSTPLYIDSQYGAMATIEVIGGIIGGVKDSLVVDQFSYVNPFDNKPKFYISSIIDAKPELEYAYSLHTFQFYFNNYSGTVHIQGSLDEQGATPFNWTTIHTLSSTNAVEYANIVGKWNWFRIYHLPTTGKLDKILYRQ